MTELKRPCVLQLRHNNSERFVYAYEVGEMNKYLSEVDKVIAEKDEKIDELEESIGELQKATDSAWSKVNAMYDELRHHKYKRCLDKADFCLLETAIFLHNEIRKNFYYKWHKRWLELAEKFKEAK